MRTLLLTVAVCALVGGGCGGADSEEVVAPPPQTTSATETETAPPDVGAGRPAAPPSEGISLDGEPLSLSDFEGRPVLVNVWSSW